MALFRCMGGGVGGDFPPPPNSRQGGGGVSPPTDLKGEGSPPQTPPKAHLWLRYYWQLQTLHVCVNQAYNMHTKKFQHIMYAEVDFQLEIPVNSCYF